MICSALLLMSCVCICLFLCVVVSVKRNLFVMCCVCVSLSMRCELLGVCVNVFVLGVLNCVCVYAMFVVRGVALCEFVLMRMIDIVCVGCDCVSCLFVSCVGWCCVVF